MIGAHPAARTLDSRHAAGVDSGLRRSYNAAAPGAQDRDLRPLGERQVPPRQRGLGDRRHPASLAEPPRPDRLRYAGLHRRFPTDRRHAE